MIWCNSEQLVYIIDLFMKLKQKRLKVYQVICNYHGIVFFLIKSVGRGSTNAQNVNYLFLGLKSTIAYVLNSH